jgi:hypothetical protein
MTCMLDNETVVAAKTLDPMFAQQLFEAGATVEAPPVGLGEGRGRGPRGPRWRRRGPRHAGAPALASSLHRAAARPAPEPLPPHLTCAVPRPRAPPAGRPLQPRVRRQVARQVRAPLPQRQRAAAPHAVQLVPAPGRGHARDPEVRGRVCSGGAGAGPGSGSWTARAAAARARRRPRARRALSASETASQTFTLRALNPPTPPPRFLWQIQYIISQGLYVIPAFHPTREPEANVVNPRLFTRNWRNLWRMLRDLPGYETRIKGRVLADLINEPSRWGCQWDRPCTLANETSPSCAPGVWLYAAAASGIHSVDRTAPILIEGMGQDAQRGQYVECAPTSFPGERWRRVLGGGGGACWRRRVLGGEFAAAPPSSSFLITHLQAPHQAPRLPSHPPKRHDLGRGLHHPQASARALPDQRRERHVCRRRVRQDLPPRVRLAWHHDPAPGAAQPGAGLEGAAGGAAGEP